MRKTHKSTIWPVIVLALGVLPGAGAVAQDDTALQAALARARTFSGSNDDWQPFVWPLNGRQMVALVPAGCFTMGSTPDLLDAAFAQCEADDGVGECERWWFANQAPARRVCFDEPFWIGKTEVTNTQFAAFLNAVGNQREGDVSWLRTDSEWGRIHQQDGVWAVDEGYESHPAVAMSWYGASAYAAWVGCSLPTEAQWEYAARGPDALIFPWGNVYDGTRLNLCDASCFYEWGINPAFDDGYAVTAPVGSFPAGASWVGALDMSGNVNEWLADWYAEDTYATLPDGALNPTGPPEGERRIIRGSSWDFDRRFAWTTYRNPREPDSRYYYIGFRVACPVQ